MKPTWPLVGRAEELTRLDQAMADPAIGGVILAGPPGVGKTRLAIEAVNTAKRRGAHGRWFVATQSAASVPFAVFAGLLDRRDLPGDDPLRLVLEARRTLAAEALGQPVVLGVDDGQLLDDASAAFVHQLAVSAQAFVVVTLRSGTRVPDPITALWKDGLAERVEIQPLGRESMDELVAAVLAGEVERATLDQLWTWTEGNPLFLREIVYGGIDRGVLVPVAGCWRWMGPVQVSPRLQEVLDARLGELADPERRALEYVALAEPIGVDVLTQVATTSVVERLEVGGLIQVDLEGRRVQARLAHPLYAAALRQGMAAIRARAVRRQLADGLQDGRARRREDVVRQALWRLDSGGPSDPELLLVAARQLAFSYLLALAERLSAESRLPGEATASEPAVTEDLVAGERLARAAWEATGNFDAGYVLSHILIWQRRDEEAETTVAGLAEVTSTEADQVRLVNLRAALLFGSGRIDEAEELVDKAEIACSSQVSRDELATVKARLAYRDGRPRDALAIASEVLARSAKPDAGGFAVARAASTAAASLALAGRTAAAIELIDGHQASALKLVTDEPLVVGEFFLTRLFAWRLEGKIADAEDLATSCYRLAVAQESAGGAAVFGGALGLLALVRGDVTTALGHLGEAEALYRDHDLFDVQPWCLAGLAQALAMTGDLDGAARALAKIDAYGTRPLGPYRTEVELARAWVNAIDGGMSQALGIALDAADLAAAAGALSYEALALHTAARLDGAGRVAQRLAELAGLIDGEAVQMYADHADALDRDDGAALLEVAERFERMGSPLLAAEAAASAARAHGRAARDASARAAAVRSQVFARRCPGVWTPGLVLAPAGPGLTKREREVASLASRGRSNAEIAGQLYLSVRTVETHLQAAYRKLGVNTRQDLATLLDAGPA